MSRALVLMLVTATAMLMAAAPAAANHVQCGDVITTNTTLDSDLACTGDALVVQAPGGTVDLADHAIRGTGSGTAIVASGGDVQVRGGTIRGFGSAIEADGPDALRVRHMLIAGNGSGVSCKYVPRCEVVDSTLKDNVATAIDMDSADGGDEGDGLVRRNRVHHNGTGLSLTDYRATVTDNRIDHNDDVGVEIDYIAQVEMSRNVVAANGGDGVVVSFLSVATISDNRIARNGGNGVNVVGDFQFQNTSAIVRGNQVVRNAGDGILVSNAEGAPRTVIERNQANHNDDDGVDVDLGLNDPSQVDTMVRRNTANVNTDLGIEAAPGTTDGGGNKAKRNGNAVQCAGVSCS